MSDVKEELELEQQHFAKIVHHWHVLSYRRFLYLFLAGGAEIHRNIEKETKDKRRAILFRRVLSVGVQVCSHGVGDGPAESVCPSWC